MWPYDTPIRLYCQKRLWGERRNKPFPPCSTYRPEKNADLLLWNIQSWKLLGRIRQYLSLKNFYRIWALNCVDNNAGAIAKAAEYEVTISGCGDIADLCNDETYKTIVRAFCPATCNSCQAPGTVVASFRMGASNNGRRNLGTFTDSITWNVVCILRATNIFEVLLAMTLVLRICRFWCKSFGPRETPQSRWKKLLSY